MSILSVMRSWVEQVTGLTVIYDGDPEPSAPRPNVDSAVSSYAAIAISDDDTGYSTAYEVQTDTAAANNTYERVLSHVREGTLQVELYGPGAVDYGRALALSVGSPDTITLLDAAGDYVIVGPGDVSDRPILRSATREPGASVAFRIRWVEQETVNMEAVESVDVTVTVTEED